MTIPHAAKKQLGITDQTFYRWRTRCGSLKGTRPSASRSSSRMHGSSASSPGHVRGHDSHCRQCAGGGDVGRDGI
jgi:hypothetical protein